METSLNNKCRAFTSLEQSKKLAEILPFESADMYYALSEDKSTNMINFGKPQGFFDKIQVAWSLASLLKVLPEINDISLKMEKVKAKDGYDG